MRGNVSRLSNCLSGKFESLYGTFNFVQYHFGPFSSRVPIIRNWLYLSKWHIPAFMSTRALNSATCCSVSLRAQRLWAKSNTDAIKSPHAATQIQIQKNWITSKSLTLMQARNNTRSSREFILGMIYLWRIIIDRFLCESRILSLEVRLTKRLEKLRSSKFAIKEDCAVLSIKYPTHADQNYFHRSWMKEACANRWIQDELIK